MLASISKNWLCDLGKLTKPLAASSQFSITNGAFAFEWLVFKNRLKIEPYLPFLPKFLPGRAQELSQLKWPSSVGSQIHLTYSGSIRDKHPNSTPDLKPVVGWQHDFMVESPRGPCETLSPIPRTNLRPGEQKYP